MTAMDRSTGALLVDDIAQSVQTILTTPLASRVMRRDFGSELPDLIDQPATARVRLFAAVATALARWEPRITVRRVQLSSDAAQQGRWLLDLAADIGGQQQQLQIPLQMGAIA